MLAKLKLTTMPAAATAAPAFSYGRRSRTELGSKRGWYEDDSSFDDERLTTLSSKVLSAIERPLHKI